jgi:hypothetical protein
MGKESEITMKAESKTVRVIPYGRLEEHFDVFAHADVDRLRLSKTWTPFRGSHELWHLVIAFSHELDEGFLRAFRERATSDTRLLVLNNSRSSDWLLTRIVNLQIRSPFRFYVADPPFAQTNEKNWEDLIVSYLGRLNAALDSKEFHGRIFDACLEDGILHVTSADFRRLEIPLSKIVPLANVDTETAENFEIDEDGSYLFWPILDLHLGWEQFQQVVDPEAIRRAEQKTHAFNVRYGAAVQDFRLQVGLALSAIPGLSEKQLRRIESGECRLTSNAAGKLAMAHGIKQNEYLQAIAAVLK